MSHDPSIEPKDQTTTKSAEEDAPLKRGVQYPPEANQEVLEALFAIAGILNKHDEEVPTESDRAAMAAVCGRIRDAVVDRFPVCKDLVPRPVPSATGITCHILISIGLGLVPQQLREPILTFLNHSDEGKCPRLSSLQNTPLDVRDIAGTLEHDSPLEWFGMNSGVQGPLFEVSQREFLRQLLRIARLSVDDAGRHEEAVKWITATHARFSTIQETGPNLPVLLYSDQHRNPVGLDVIDAPASYFDHTIQAYFANELKQWLLFRLDGKQLVISGDSGTPIRLQAGKGSEFDCDAYAFPSAAELAKGVGKIQNREELNLIPVHSRRESRPAALLPAYFGNGREHEFWGGRMKDPIVLRECKEGAVILSSLKPTARGDEKVLFWKVQDVPGTPTNQIVRFATSVLAPMISSQTYKDLTERRGSEGILKMRSLYFDDLHTLHLLEKPLPLRKPEELWQPGYKHKGTTVLLHGFQGFTSDGLLYPIFKYPELAISGRDFGNRKLVLTYASAGKLIVGRPINRLPMGFTYLPALESLGFEKDGSGNNALTNQWDLCIPLRKPTAQRFKHPLLKPIQALQSVSHQDWPLLVHSLEGDWVSSISEIAERLRGREPSEPADVLTSPGLPNVPRIGDFYKAPRESVDIYPPWIISNCVIEGQRFYIVDSPLYGDALYLYRFKEGAKLAAEHLARHGRRSEAREFAGFVQRVTHREGWRERLTAAVYDQILRRPVPPDAKELGM